MTVLRDRSFIEQMKADILRRVEEPSDSEAEQINIFGVASKNKGKVREVAFDDDLDDVGSVRVAGDGEESSEGGDDDEEEEEEEPQIVPQTILELAYIGNPKVFERDAATRRSKERAALRAQTGASGEKNLSRFKDMSLSLTLFVFPPKAGSTNKLKVSGSCSNGMCAQLFFSSCGAMPYFSTFFFSFFFSSQK
jgi:hypothetical protein